MTTTTANTAPYPELVAMCHQYYALGQRITDYITQQQISNTIMNGVCVEVKTNRGTKVTATHTGILTLLAGN